MCLCVFVELLTTSLFLQWISNLYLTLTQDFSTSSVKSYWLLPKLAVLVKFILLEKVGGFSPNLNSSLVCNMTCSFITEQQNSGFAYFSVHLLIIIQQLCSTYAKSRSESVRIMICRLLL